MERPVVAVSQGLLRGAVKTLRDGSPYHSFKGVPYARPPTGELRFKAPVPPEPWTEIYDATEHGSVCPHFDNMQQQIVQGDENCLFLNVYTRSLQKNQRTPVMVYIHGGGFLEGSGNSDMYGPEFMMQHDVVLVTINYRLDVLGFLCLDTAEAPGNAGMKDQVAALRWVRDNIAKFGGDPSNVTIFGESAGSASVTFHLLSPMSKGLFQKAIAQSGVCTSDWAVARDAKTTAFKIGEILGKNTTDTTELLEFLKNVPFMDLVNLSPKVFANADKLTTLPLLFTPVVEKSFDDVEPFLIESPLDILRSGKVNRVPLVIGYTSQEGLLFIAEKVKSANRINENLQICVPSEIARCVEGGEKKKIGEKIKEFYVGDRHFSEDTIAEIGSFFGDPFFVYQIHLFVYIYSKFCKDLYMYKFDCDTDLNFYKKATGFRNVKGACHADDLAYVFRSKHTPEDYEEQEHLQTLVRRVTKLWTDFAKFGNPTPDESLGVKWPPYTADAKEFLHIDDALTVGTFADREKFEFWDEMYRTSGLPCIATLTQ